MKRSVVGIMLIAAGLIIGFSFLNMGSVGSFFTDLFVKDVHIEKNVEAKDLQKILVDSRSSNVKVIQGNSDEIRILLHGKASPKYIDQIGLKVEARANQLELGTDLPKVFGIGINIISVTLTIEVPEKQWEMIEVSVGSGNVEMAGMNGNSVSIKTSSGNIRVEEVEARTVEVHASSGNIKADGFKAEELILGTSSGNVTLSNANGKTVNVKTSSGNVVLADIEAAEIALRLSSGNLRVEHFQADQLQFDIQSGNAKLIEGEAALLGETGSGNIRIEVAELLRDMDLQTRSGNVTVVSDREPKSLEVDFRAGLGKGVIQWDGMNYTENADRGKSIKGTIGNGEVMIKVRTGSGNFTLGNG